MSDFYFWIAVISYMVPAAVGVTYYLFCAIYDVVKGHGVSALIEHILLILSCLCPILNVKWLELAWDDFETYIKNK